MKTLPKVLALALTLTTTSAMGWPAPVLNEKNFIVINSDEVEKIAHVSYPGMNGERCRVAIEVSTPHTNDIDLKFLSENLNLTAGYPKYQLKMEPIIDGKTLRYNIPNERLSAYMVYIYVKTKDGSSLNETIAAIDSDNLDDEPVTVILKSTNCQ